VVGLIRVFVRVLGVVQKKPTLKNVTAVGRDDSYDRALHNNTLVVDVFARRSTETFFHFFILFGVE